jgi:hypothetical protein
MLMHKLPKPEIAKSQRAEVVGRVDITWMDMDPWDVCNVPVGSEGKLDAVGAGGSHLR